jgi:hypothetical protein
MGRTTSTRLAGIVCAAGLLLLGPARLCHGGSLLNFQLDPNSPVISGFNGSLRYNATTGELVAIVDPLIFTSPNPPGGGYARFRGGTETIDLFVNPDGTFRRDGTGMQLNGSLSIGGTIISGTLLTGEITAFGADPPGSLPFTANLLFKPEGGLLTQPIPLAGGGILPIQFPLGGAEGGIDLFAEKRIRGVPGDFTRDFDLSKLKKLEGLTLVPEPASWVLGTIGLVVLSTFVLIRKKSLPDS